MNQNINKTEKSQEGRKTEFDIANGLVSREELKKNFESLSEDLSDRQFHSVYHLVWSLSASSMLLRQQTEELGKRRRKAEEDKKED